MRGEVAERFLKALLGDGGEAPAVDWQRFRLMQLIQGTAGAEAELKEQLVGRGLVEIARAPMTAEAERRAIASLRSLVEILLPRGFRVVDDYVNPMLVGLASGPTAGTPPNLTRFLTQLSEVARAAQAVTVAAREDEEGRKLMTLLFVDEKYVGFLPGSRVRPS